jgi:uncharacterized membrane protein (DUF485 family)
MADANRDENNHISLGLRFRRMLVISASFAAAIQVCLVLYALVAGQGSLERLFFAAGLAQDPHAQIGIFLIVALIVFALIVRIGCNNLDAWPTETDVDSFLRRRNATTMLLVMYVGYVLVNYLVENVGNAGPVEDLPVGALALLFFAGDIVLGPFVFGTHPEAAVAREAFKDEFYRAMRAKASKALYAVVMLAGSAAVLLLHYHLTEGPAILFAALYAGVAGSLLYYDYLIWRADRAH